MQQWQRYPFPIGDQHRGGALFRPHEAHQRQFIRMSPNRGERFDHFDFCAVPRAEQPQTFRAGVSDADRLSVRDGWCQERMELSFGEVDDHRRALNSIYGH